MSARGVCARGAWLALSLSGCFHTLSGADDVGTDAGSDVGPDAGTDAGPGEQGPPRHAACATPLDATALADAFVADPFALQQADQNAFLDSACDEVELPARCSADRTCATEDTCLVPVQGQLGYCVNRVDDRPQLFSYRAGLCRTDVLGALDKAALCCAGIPGLDCRPLPFRTLGGPGLACASTAECEAGLVCRTALSSYGEPLPLGLCMCPGADSAALANPGFCGVEQFFEPGQPAQPAETGACSEATAAGFVQEVLSNEWPPRGLEGGAPLRVPGTPSGAPAFVDYRDRAYLIALASDVPSGPAWTKAKDFGFGYGLYAPALDGYLVDAVFDDAGRLHVVHEHDGLFDVLVGGAGEDFRVRELPAACGVFLAFAVDAQGRHHVACSRSPGLRYMAEGADGWTVREHDLGDFRPGRIFFASDGRALATASHAEASVFELDSGDELLHDAAYVDDVAIDGARAVLVARTDEGFHLLTTRDGGPFVHERITLPTAVARSTGDASLVLGPSDVAIVHSTNDGISLTERVQGAWATRTLSTDAATPHGARGADGDLQVFYMVDTNWDFRRQADEFRRLRAGACRP